MKGADGVAAKKRSNSGLSLLEVLLVLAILGLLAAIVVPHLIGRQRQGLIRATRISIVGLEGALRMYATEHEGEFPDGRREEVFQKLMQPPDRDDGPAAAAYLEEPPRDAWDQLLYYEYPNTRKADAIKPAIWSSGPNRTNENGGGDDINNWDEQ